MLAAVGFVVARANDGANLAFQHEVEMKQLRELPDKVNNIDKNVVELHAEVKAWIEAEKSK
jgi:hypothetical protein